MSLRDALSALAGINVTGIANSYDVDAAPRGLADAHLPALLIMPDREGEGFLRGTFTASGSQVTYRFTHLLLVAPLSAPGGTRQHTPTVIDLVDAYVAALKADPVLSGELNDTLRFRIAIGPQEHAEETYHGAAFTHEWTFHL